jgi:excisionase family DNA binding protein
VCKGYLENSPLPNIPAAQFNLSSQPLPQLARKRRAGVIAMSAITEPGLVLDPSITSTHLPTIEIRALKIPEVAAILNLSVKSVWNLISAGHLAPVKYGRSTRLLSDEVEEFMRTGTVEIARAFVVEKLAE